MFIVIALYDSCDPVAYGTFKTEELAQQKAKEVRNNFDGYDHNHCHELVVTQLK